MVNEELDPQKAAILIVNTLQDISKHANVLATGLQNVSPPTSDGPPKSILYLANIAQYLLTVCDSLAVNTTNQG